ncbi:MAG: YraN family protein [Halioglobus sp.]
MRQKGLAFERRAAAYLEDRGVHILVSNFSARTGEIDLVGLDDDALVFFEVRARSNPRFNSASGSVDRRKQQRLLRTAQYFLQRYPRLADRPCRFDVIAFEPPQSGTELDIHWIRGAFTA